MEDRIAAFLERHRLPETARDELEQMLQGYGIPLAGAALSTGGNSDSTLMFEPEEYADTATSALDLDAERAADRYDDLAFIGRGSFAEVRRVRDKALNRVMAMKILDRGGCPVSAGLRARFVQEAQATAQLQHPAIVPVHELGVLPDGRLFFTMEEVRGRTLSAVVDAVHRVSVDVWARTGDGWSLRRLVEVFRRVCEAVAYAHSRGVVHRDLKPANVMVGAFGEVRVMDWGIAKVLGSGLGAVIDAAASDPNQTRDGVVAGTPAFMAPEQARGEIHAIDRRTDVYALGSILYYLLANSAPYEGSSSAEVLDAVCRGEPRPLVGRKDGPLLPAGLVEITERAMQTDPERRHPDAEKLAVDVGDWLDGAERRESALRAVAGAAESRRAAKKLYRRAESLREAAAAYLAELPEPGTIDDKAQAWRWQDEADVLEVNARRHELALEQRLDAAFAHEAELPEAHLMMARIWKTKHVEAERSEDQLQVERAELLLAHHLDALPVHWPGRKRLDAYREGTGRLVLDTTTPCEATLTPLEMQDRRWVLGEERSVGSTPLDLPLGMGRYVLSLSEASGEEVFYPVHIGRQERWEHVDPGGEARPLRIPDDLEGGEVFVPAGWFVAGGDERAPYGLPERRLWCDSFVMAVFPVTHAEWLRFLEAVDGDRHVPRNDDGRLLYSRSDEGWTLERPDGEAWLADAPVTHIDWYSAEAYAEWRASEDRLPWRLPFELEWEKAARGVDGRALPWGDRADAVFCNLHGSLEGRPRLVEVERFPTDISVYGVRGLAGNSADWCADDYGTDGPVVAGQRVVRDEGSQQTARFRSVRGGSFRDGPEAVRCASRWRLPPDSRSGRVGVRLVRSVDG